MVSAWLLLPAVVLPSVVWYLLWNAAFTARILWQAKAEIALNQVERALAAAEGWRRRAEELEGING